VSADISANLHGGNFVVTANSINSDSAFTNAYDRLSLTYLRFPGGDLIERHFDPGSATWDDWLLSTSSTIMTSSGRSVASVHSFLSFAAETGSEVVFTLPTAPLIIRNEDGSFSVDMEKVHHVAESVESIMRGDYGSVRISAFEIGNEYYLDGRMTAEEYGAVANKLTNAVDDAINRGISSRQLPFEATQPDIIVQAGAPWQVGDNQTIISELDESARESIDGLVVHWYPRDLAAVDRLGGQFSVMNDWDAADGFRDLQLHVTEWNVHNVPAGDKGMLQASTLISGYERIITEGVDSANFWGIEFDRLRTRLAFESGSSNSEAPSAELTPSGEVIRSLFNSTVGLSVLDISPESFIQNVSDLGIEGEDYTITAFGDESRAVIYLASRDDESSLIDLNIDQYFDKAHFVVVERFSVKDDPTTAADEGNPLSDSSRPSVTVQTFSVDQIADLAVSIGPYEIIRIEILVGEVGAEISGQEIEENAGLDLDDQIDGSKYDDTLRGAQGNDSFTGAAGRDIIFGGAGLDQISGGAGNDVIFGGDGADKLFGEQNSDLLFGGEDNDQVSGQGGNDILFGGNGENTLRGGEGQDTIFSNGDDQLFGGNGRDFFFVSTDHTTIIADWSPESNELISFQGTYSDPEEVRSRLVETTYKDGAPGDLIIRHDSGEETILRGAAGQSEVLLANLADQSEIGDFTLDQADFLSSLSVEQIYHAFESLSSEGYSTYTQSINVGLLFYNLEGEKIAALLNGLGGEDASDWISRIPKSEMNGILGEMDSSERSEFFLRLNDESLEAIMENISSSDFSLITDDLDDTAMDRIGDFVSVNYGQSTNQDSGSSLDDLEWWNSMPKVEQPPVDKTEEEIEEEEQNNPNSPSSSNNIGSVAASCFIASAVYANPQHPSVWLLRWYRDEVLRTYALGRLLIALYWAFGPKLAEKISGWRWSVCLFMILIELIVSSICWIYGRSPGRQTDHKDHPDSRMIKIGSAAMLYSQRERARK